MVIVALEGSKPTADQSSATFTSTGSAAQLAAAMATLLLLWI